MKRFISFHAAHDACICTFDEDGIQVFELEKMYNVKHLDFRSLHRKNQEKVLRDLVEYFGDEYDVGLPIYYSLKNRKSVHSYNLTVRSNEIIDEFLKGVGCTDIRPVNHHLAHANAAFYQSPFRVAYCVVNDAGIGSDVKVASYGCNPKGVRLIEHHLDEFHPDKLFKPVSFYTKGATRIKLAEHTSRLDAAGKMMGLSAYGEEDTPEYKIGYDSMMDHELDMNPRDFKSFQEQANFALGLQHAFEMVMLKFIERRYFIIKEKFHGNIVLAGGGALNILANARIQETYPEFNIFVPPNPGDESVALGAIMKHIQHEVAE